MSRLDFAEQYGCPCVIVEAGDTAEEIINRAVRDEATYYEGDDEDVLYCVQFQGRPMELYTDLALRRSMRRTH